MFLTRFFRNKRNSERGFILIVALMAIMILTAIGFFALTTTSQDIRISSRIVGERKAFSAAQAGLHAFCLMNFTSGASYPDLVVDAANDPNARYDIGTVAIDPALPKMPAPGEDESKKMVHQIYQTEITGRIIGAGSRVSTDVGVKYGPVPDGTEYL